MRSEVGSEEQACVQNALAFRRFVLLALDVDDVEFTSKTFGEARSAGDEVASLGTGADADRNLLSDCPMRSKLLAIDIVVQRAIDRARYAMQRHFAESDQVAAAEEVGEGPLGAFKWIDIAASHAGCEGFGR